MIITFKNLRRAVAAIALVGTFVVAGCTGEIEKRVSELEDRVASLEQLTQALNAKLGDNLLVKSVTSVGGGWDIVFSNDSRIEVRPPVDGEDGADGADGVSPKIKVAPNGDDGLSIWYNITKDYPESGWVNTEINIQGEPGESGLDISSLFEMQITDDGKLQYTLDGETWVDVLDVSGLGGTAIVVRENPDGTVTFVTADGEYTFAQAQGPVSPITGFTLLWSTEEDIKVGDTPQAAFIVRISPSDAPMPAVGMWTLDEVTSGLTRASYLNPSKVIEIASIEKDKIEDEVLDGQYIIKVKSAVGAKIDEYGLALVLNVGTTSAPSLISSDAFTINLAAGELLVGDVGSVGILTDGLNDDGYAKEDPYSFKFTPADETTWTMTITSPAPKTRAEYNDAAEWVTVGIKGGSEYNGPRESDEGKEVELEIELDPNNTGKSRSAVITISTEKEEEEGKGDPDGYGEFSFTITQEDAFDVLVDGKLKKALVDALKVKLSSDLDNGRLSKATAKGKTELNLTYVEDKVELTGADLAGLAEFFPDLTSLTLSGHEELGAVDLSGFEKLTTLTIVESGLTSITMPALAKDAKANLLTTVTITGNEDLKSIDLSKAAALTEVDLNGNGLTTIALPAKAEDLTDLNVADNKLASITLPEAKLLATLDVSNNLLKSLDITMLDKDVLDKLIVKDNPGLEKETETRAADKYEFKVKVWKQFDVEEEVGDNWPADKETWHYFLTEVDQVTVEVIYDVTPSVYATSVEIKSLNSKKPLAGSAGARTVTITTADTLSLKALITPANADNKTVVWDSSDDDIASIDPTTGKLTIKTVGQVIFNVDAKGYETGKEQPFDKVTITINPAVRATDIKIDVYSSDELTEGNLVEDVEAITKPTDDNVDIYLGATVTPGDATLKDKVEWSITDDDDDAFSIVGNVITIDKEKVNYEDSIVVTATIENGLAFGEHKKETLTLIIEEDIE